MYAFKMLINKRKSADTSTGSLVSVTADEQNELPLLGKWWNQLRQCFITLWIWSDYASISLSVISERRGVSANSPQRFVHYKKERKGRQCRNQYWLLFLLLPHPLYHSALPPLSQPSPPSSGSPSLIPHRKYPTLARSGPDWPTPPGPRMGGTEHTSRSDYGRSVHCGWGGRKGYIQKFWITGHLHVFTSGS